MGFVNGLSIQKDKCRVQIKVEGTLICKTFSVKEHGNLEQAIAKAKSFIRSRRAISDKSNRTGVRNIYEKTVTVNGTTYLYLTIKRKGKDIKSLIVGRYTDLEKIRRTKKYRVVLSNLSSYL